MNNSRGLKTIVQLAKLQHHLIWWMCMPMVYSFILDRSLMTDWRKHSGKPERVSSQFTFVCVCVHARGLLRSWSHFLATKTNFWVEWSLENEKETFFSSKIQFLRFWLTFFLYVTIVKFCFPATGHSFSSRNVKFWLRRPCTNRN